MSNSTIPMYFSKKEEMSAKAYAWAEKMDKEYAKETKESVKNSTIYNQEIIGIPLRQTIKTQISVEDLDSVSAIFKYRRQFPDKQICVLNFASYKNPGGKF